MSAHEPVECPVCADLDSLARTLAGDGADVSFGWVAAPVVAAGAGWALCVALGSSTAVALGAALATGLAGAGAAALRASAHAASRRARTRETFAHLKVHGEEHDALARMAGDTNPDALVLYREDGLVLYANPAARELFFDGQSPAGQNFLDLLERAPQALREALMGEPDRLFTLDAGGQPETHHVTRRAHALNGTPHTVLIVKHMTREIARREVEMLKKVVRVISHEINNSLAPIASLVASARLAADRPQHRDKLQRALDTIEERAKHLQAFLNGYAGLARLPAPKPRAVDWGALLGRLRALLPELMLPAAPDAPGWFDPAQLEQVLLNLFKNAVEAGSAPDSVELSVSIEADGWQRFEVRDRGRGFSCEALSSAVLPFYTTKDKGSGLGLALCREIVEAHGGALSLANRDGGGATVSISLPGSPRDGAAVARSRARLTLSRS